jgi:DNA-nicking Smr family endonuclease
MDDRVTATMDLHGLPVLEAVRAVEQFLRAQRRARPGAQVRIITGRGRAGGGAPIRTRVRTLLRGLAEQGGVVRGFELEETEGSFLVRLGG